MVLRHHSTPLILCILVLMSLGCSSDKGAPPTPELLKATPGLVDACGPSFANLMVPVGAERDLVVTLDRYIETAEPSVITAQLCRRDTNVIDVGWGLFALGMAQLSSPDASDALNFITLSATDYHNPMAMSQLARIHFYGSKRMQLKGVTVRPDRTQAVVYLSAAFRIGQLDAKLRGSPMVLDRVKATVWSITERLNVLAKNGQFNQRDALMAHKERVIEAVERYEALYF